MTNYEINDIFSEDDSSSIDENNKINEVKRILLPCFIDEKPVYDSGDGNYIVLSAKIDSASHLLKNEEIEFPQDWKRKSFKIVVRTEMQIINPYVVYMMSGKVVDNNKYGKQFDVDFYYIDEIKNINGVCSYLDKLPQVGYIRARTISNLFGGEGIDSISKAIINDDGLALTQVSGITEERAKKISDAWKKDSLMRELYMWFVGNDFPMNKIGHVFSEFGVDSKVILSKNPYAMADVKEIGFNIADNFAHKIGNVNPIDRIEACSKFIIKEWMKEGNLCIGADKLGNQCGKILSDYLSSGIFVDKFTECMKTKFVSIKFNNKTYIYLPIIFNGEREIAKTIVELSTVENYKSIDASYIDLAQIHVSEWTGREIVLDKSQREAIASAFNNKITVITGGGGTGKSTICQCIKTIASKKRLKILFLAPTGAAAKVLSHKTGEQAMTIHRALRINKNIEKKNENKEIECDILVIDEFSMVGFDTMTAIMKAISKNLNMNVVFVGDPQQIPSISPGNFLSDIISSNVANVVKLSIVHRQNETSYIPYVANEMAKGIFTSFPNDATDIEFFESRNEESIRQYVLHVMKNYINKYGKTDGFQVISSMKKRGNVCVNELNDIIQMTLFDDKKDTHVMYNYRKFFVGDRVMQTVNDYNKNIFNGNIGTVIDCGEEVDPLEKNRKQKFVTVKYENPPINGVEQTPEICKYVKKDIDDIMVCWCSTVHKFQGSQAHTIVFVAPEAHYHMIKKELVYTAMTRASNMLHIAGGLRTLANASQMSVITSRNTHTKEFIMIKNGSINQSEMIVRNANLS